jgi:predicted RecB family nuclease
VISEMVQRQAEHHTDGETRVRLGPAAATSCRRRIHLDHDPDAERPEQSTTDPAGALIRAEIAAHRARMVDTVQLPGLLRSQRLVAGALNATIDLLVPVPGGYLPILVKGHRTLDPGAGAVLSSVSDPLQRMPSGQFKQRPRADDAMALAHCTRVLQALGLAAPGPPLGGVIGRGNSDDSLIYWYELSAITGDTATSLLDEFDIRISDRTAVAEAALRRDPALALPSRVSECRRCPWDSRCTVEMTVAHDVSLIAPGGDAVNLRSAGVSTIDDLATATSEQLAAVAPSWRTGAPRGTEIRDKARAWLVGAAMVRRREVVSVPRADIELDVDMECFMDAGAYLWGTFLDGSPRGLAAAADAGFEAGYWPFATWAPLPSVTEGEAFADFWGYLRELQLVASECGLTFAAYCYSRQAEEKWLFSTPARFPQVAGMPSIPEVRAFTTSAAWVDMYEMIDREFVATGSKRLKSLAPLAGFRWRDPEPDGANSMVWYQAAVGALDGKPDPASEERLLRYNEDDVLATRALRNWMASGATSVPSAVELARLYERSKTG